MDNKDDDDEGTDTSISVARYPIMPSRMVLQTMRNRLNLAFLGKKLMKWAALATGKELRRLSVEISELLKDYGVRIREAFMHLARCRYQLPPMNVIALECCPQKARLTVQMSTRSVAGVKVISLGVVESGPDGYSFLGLGKGGEVIKETKKAWYELLKIMILLAQFRISFALIDNANRAATKKQNVLQRLIIPKINLTLRYILSELDEQEREESFRLKRFKQLKYKYENKEELDKVEEEKEDIEIAAKKKEVVVLPKPEPKPKPKPESKPEPGSPKLWPTDEELIIEHMHEVVRLAEIIQNAALIQQNFGLTRCDLGKLKWQLHETLKLSQTSKEQRECIKCTASQCHCPASLNPTFVIPPSNENLEVFRPPGYESALKLMPTKKVATPMPGYIMQPQDMQPQDMQPQDMQPQDMQPQDKPPQDKPHYRPGNKIEADDRLNDLQNHVDRVICLTHCYKQDGVLSNSAENFLKCCQNVKIKIDEIKEHRKASAKINRLKWEIEHLEQVTDTIRKEGLSCDSISSFMSCCKDFKTKLESRKASKGAPSVCSIEKLIERINVSIELSKEAKMEGLVTESLEEFIETCKEIKAKIDTQEEETKPKVINDLRVNLNDIMQCISKYKQGGLLSESIEKFYTSCESTKAKLDDYRPPPGVELDESQMTTIKHESQGSNTPKKDEICPTCQKPDNHSKISYTKFARLCTSCKKSISPEEESHSEYAIFGPVGSRHGSQDKPTCQETDTCKCAPLQKSEPDSCNCGKEKGKAKFNEDCPKYMKGLTGSLPFCKTEAKSSNTSEALSTKDTGISKTCSPAYTADILLKSQSCSCKSNSLQSYVISISSCSQITALQLTKTYIQMPMQTCKSFQSIALDKTICKNEYNSKSFQTIDLDKTICKNECDSKSFQTIDLDKTICKNECDSKSFQTIDLDKTICKNECDIKSFQTIDLDKTICKNECNSKSFQTSDLDKTICKNECNSKSYQTIDLDKTKCKECDDNKDQKRGDTVSMNISTKFKNIGVNSVKDSNLVPRKLGQCKSVKSTNRVCNAPTTKGFIQIVRNAKSEELIWTQDLSDPYPPCPWSHTSTETLTRQDRNNESDSAQVDPFFCCNSSTSNDNSGPVLPL